MGQPAARVTDMHTCPMVTPGTPPVPHVGGPILPSCSTNVITGGLPQARVTDKAYCVGPPDVIVKGSMTVLVNNLPAARIGDQTVHGGVIVTGMPTVLIGDVGGGSAGTLGSSSVAKPTVSGGDAAGAAGKSAADAASSGAKAAAAPPTTGLGKEVDALVAKSPTLSDKIARLQKDGWEIKPVATEGSSADKTKKIIYISTKDNTTTELQTQVLSHEAGHADYKADPFVPKTAGMTEDQFAAANTRGCLKDEGEATLSNIQTRQEIIDAGGSDIGIAGNPANGKKYQDAYDAYQKDGDRDAARGKIGDVFADGEFTSTTKESYRTYYEKSYRDYYKKTP